MAEDAPIIDLYSGLDHKVGMGRTAGTKGIDAAPAYLDDNQRRRLNAYARLRAYIETVARHYLADDPDDPAKKDNLREFGDPAVLMDRIVAGVIGDDPTVAVIGADTPIPDQPDIPPAPVEPDKKPTDTEQRIAAAVFEAVLTRWEERAQEILDKWLTDIEALGPIQERQVWLHEWAEAEALFAKLLENESENITPLGSGVYAVGWNSEANRPTLEIFEPDVYMPVLSDSRPSVFPDKVHLVWIFTERQGDEEIERVRRITYELITLEDAQASGIDPGTRPGYLAPEAEWTKTCLLSDALFDFESFKELEQTQGSTFAQQMVDTDLVATDQIPLGLDFIPLVHVPSFPASNTHFGRPILARIGQLFDEIAATDTDEAKVSRLAASPPIAASGLGPGRTELDLRPDKIIALEAGGQLSTIDLADNAEALAARAKELRKLLSVVGQVPDGILGRVDASDVPSGKAFTLSLTPYERLIMRMRLVRDAKHALLLKMVQRIAIQNEAESLGGSTDVFPAAVRLGSFMPDDLTNAAVVISGLLNARAISQQTAITMGRDNGIPIDDPTAELAAIRSIMTDEADQITAALEDPKYAAAFLGIEFEPQGIDPDGPVIPPPGSTTP